MPINKKAQKIVVNYLANSTPYGKVATTAQLKAAAKSLIRSGYLPGPLATKMGL